MYEDLVKALRAAYERPCNEMECPGLGDCTTAGCLFREAADAIESLQKACANYAEQAEENGELATELATNSKNVATWLPASRPPEEPGQYLVFIRFPENDVENWEMFGLEAPVGMVSEAYFNKDQFLWQTESDAYNAMPDLVDAEHDSAVTHWMKLPPMPEVET